MRFKESLTESINDKGILKAVFMAGHPGSGKSYVIKKIKAGSIEPRVVSSDTWSEFLKKGSNKDWKKYESKIKELTKEQLTLHVNSMLPLWIDGTSANSTRIFVREAILDKLGYDSAMVWVNTSLETALKRAKEREEKPPYRHVDPEFIKHAYNTIQKLKPIYKSHFKTFIEVNNDEGELTDKAILKAFRKATGFFTSPVKNKRGSETVAKMKENGWKYLDDGVMDMNKIKSSLGLWFRS